MLTPLKEIFRSQGDARKKKAPQPHRKLGAFVGVFTPTILTILGVIMYLRFGWVLGQVGLLSTLLIVILANCITFITSLCLSAIATPSFLSTLKIVEVNSDVDVIADGNTCNGGEAGSTLAEAEIINLTSRSIRCATGRSHG